jgi:ribosomal protein S18 acetylase RimI-like enzyme
MPGADLNESGQRRSIRPATAADVEAIERLVGRAYGVYVERIGGEPGPMHHDYRERVAEADVSVVEDRGNVIGLLVLYVRDDHLLIENVAVDPDRQGEGTGRQLLALAESRARDAGLDTTRLFTHELMSENIALYERLGYGKAKELSEQDPYGRVFMTKRLG